MDHPHRRRHPYGVFTPFWKACLATGEPREPLAAPETLAAHPVPSDELDDWNLLPTKPDWAGGLRETWTPGSAGAHERLKEFAEECSPTITAATSRASRRRAC